MKFATLKYLVLSWSAALTIWIIILMPFHAFLTVWGASIVGHYTLLRLWKEIVLLVCAVAAIFLLITDKKMRGGTLNRRLVWLILAYIALTLICGLFALNRGAVTPFAMIYGLVDNSRFLIFFLITWLVSLRLSRLHTYWQWMILWPATFVIGFGILQLFLPNDFLAKFGYGLNTISPYFTINSNEDFVRIASTLRGPNPLGAYLIVPITMLTALLLKKKIEHKQIVLLGAALLCLVFTFSRSAWIGALVSLAIVVAVSLKTHRARQIALAASGVVLLLGLGSFALIRQNDTFENVVFHTQAESQIELDSNESRATALKSGLHDVAYNPLGSGTGTAGPASAHNDKCPTRISENYFVQIGQETGWLGLGLFILINIGVGYLLWSRRSDPLALSLFASLIGLTIVNMLSHAWTDDTIAYIWWGLAGIAMAPNLKKIRQQKSS